MDLVIERVMGLAEDDEIDRLAKNVFGFLDPVGIRLYRPDVVGNADSIPV
jgi:hypothetical protein